MHLQIEKKYIVKMPNVQQILKEYGAQKKQIDQTYLQASVGERRVRCEIEPWDDGEFICRFYYGVKTSSGTDGLIRNTEEEKVDYRVYQLLLKEADKDIKTLQKTRYIFAIKNQVCKLDIYPFNTQYAILELTLESEDKELQWPEGIECIKEVTSDERFKNKELARTLRFPAL